MKILVLMPCDERMVYNAAKLYQELPKEIKDITFNMPMFMDYLVNVKIVDNWVMAFYDALISAEKLYAAAQKSKKDLIIFGNMPLNLPFDAVFNFQDAEEKLPYEDKFLEKIKEIVADEPILAACVEKMHSAEESKLSLINCKASAEFLSKYIKTDPKLEEIKEKYKDKLNFKKGVTNDR